MDAPPPSPPPRNEIEWAARIEDLLTAGKADALASAEQALERFPTSGLILTVAAFAAVIQNRPDRALMFLKRLSKWYVPAPPDQLCRALALSLQGRWPLAQAVFHEHLGTTHFARVIAPPFLDGHWLALQLKAIERWGSQRPAQPRRRPAHPPRPSEAKTPAAPAPLPQAKLSAAEPPFPLLPAQIPVQFEFPDAETFAFLNAPGSGGLEAFRARRDLAEISLAKGFDQLLCLAHLPGVEQHWYQIETARKVLRQFRGRVLLADEVGLGKTIEAGMILKEYLLRGMAASVLILTPSALVGQWAEEMATKFGLPFRTTSEPLLQRDPDAFWQSPRIIASLATARRAHHAERIRGRAFDIVIVDEAHHLKNRATQNWKLVDSLQKRFLLLLSATPVQNNLVELYNVLTLLKPGIFKTEREFRAIYMTPGQPRVPVNPEKLQELMRDVMIRNTRGLVDVRLPPRHAATIRVEGTAEETECYGELDRLARECHHSEEGSHPPLALRHLLEAAGSCPFAAARAVQRFAAQAAGPEWSALAARYAALPAGAKVRALLELLRRNPEEKKIVFVRLQDTLTCLDEILREHGLAFARFDGRMSGPEKDRAIEAFRTAAPVLLSTESGGEGRNLQFCNTLINFDLPWNPQVIEQRIGRIHRIGQTRDVFVFNLVTGGTIEDGILRILDEKINMFELVVGEIQSILGAMEEEEDFGHLVFTAWAQATAERRTQAFAALGDELLRAKEDYQAVKALDDGLFGEELEVV